MVSVIAGRSGGDADGENGSASGENAGGDKPPVRYLLPGSAPQDFDAAVQAINEKLEADGLNLPTNRHTSRGMYGIRRPTS